MSRTYRIIYVEDEDVWEDLLRQHLESVNNLEFNVKFGVKCELVRAKTGDSFLSKLTTDGPFDLAVIDLELKGDPIQGVDLLKQLQRIGETLPRIVLTARPWMLPVEEALDYGISEYYLKDTLIAGDKDHETRESHRENIRRFLETFFDLPSRYDFASEEGRRRFGLKREEATELKTTIIGDELCMWRVKARIAAAARSNLPVLITGESGTGKELAAEMIHRLSDCGWKNHDWVAVNCAAFAPDLLMSELFGHVKGAFTDARTDKRGLLEEANKSTLFLDEVGHADYRFQASLLRALSTERVRRIGSTEEYTFKIRLIAATDQSVFEQDKLQHSFINRLAGIHIEMPPLRERLSDIDNELLVGFFASKAMESAEKGKPLEEFTPAAIMALRQYHWPGNVRELKHIVHAATLEAIRMSGRAPKVKVDSAQVKWLLQQSMARLARPEKESDDVFALFTAEGHSYKSVERRFLAYYVHTMHQKRSNGERTNSAYEKTARVLGCSVSTVKAKLADYDQSFSEEAL
ncbi:sigma-54-dependent Fis family transcriptional regulator [Candidatus Poribacteria bacterium]|nr:sigma-54-dependent Fis family transcriptional regulator [Candidatus Poribacteria bacterium]